MTQLPLWTPYFGEARTNFERTGERDVTPSRWFRETALPGQRDIDLDMSSWNPDCTQAHSMFEFTAQTNWERKGCTALRHLSERVDAFAVLVAYKWGDLSFTDAVAYKVWSPSGELVERRTGASWDDLRRLREQIRDLYR